MRCGCQFLVFSRQLFFSPQLALIMTVGVPVVVTGMVIMIAVIPVLIVARLHAAAGKEGHEQAGEKEPSGFIFHALSV